MRLGDPSYRGPDWDPIDDIGRDDIKEEAPASNIETEGVFAQILEKLNRLDD